MPRVFIVIVVLQFFCEVSLHWTYDWCRSLAYLVGIVNANESMDNIQCKLLLNFTYSRDLKSR